MKKRAEPVQMDCSLEHLKSHTKTCSGKLGGLCRYCLIKTAWCFDIKARIAGMWASVSLKTTFPFCLSSFIRIWKETALYFSLRNYQMFYYGHPWFILKARGFWGPTSSGIQLDSASSHAQFQVSTHIHKLALQLVFQKLDNWYWESVFSALFLKTAPSM